MKFNYHTHTSRCFHAKGEDEEYILAAIEAGFDEIGFADHSPWPYRGYVSGMRMHENDFEPYVRSIKALREKYKDKISIKIGLECEYFKEYIPWLREKIDELGVDYIILGHHYSTHEVGADYNGALTTVEGIKKYTDQVVEGIRTGLFSYVCHPDLYMKGYQKWDSHCEEMARKIISAANETDIPLEYNLLGLSRSKNEGVPGYPYHDFWLLASEMGAKAIIGVDAHQPDAYGDTELFEEGRKNLSELNIETVDTIKFFR